MLDKIAENEKKRVALSSIAAAIFITGFKLVVGLQTNSLGILSEAAHSGLDFIAAVMTYTAVVISGRPADEKHHYGHGKIENVSAFFQTLLLVVTCAWIIWEAVDRLITRPSHVEASVWGFLVIGISIVVDISRSRALNRVAKKYDSQALEADALHFSSDVWSSSVVIIGLLFVSLNFIWVDAVAAIGVAFLVLFVSYRLGRRTIDALMDRVPDGIHEDIVALVKDVDGVERVKSVRVRTSGGKLFVDATVEIPRVVPFQKVHVIMDRIERSIYGRYQNADVIVHAEPCECEDETVTDKIRMIVVGKGLRAPHNLEVHHSGGKYYIDFDLEHSKGKSFVEAHDLTSEIEDAIRRKVPDIGKITIHMEEIQLDQSGVLRKTKGLDNLREEVRRLIIADRRVLRCSTIDVMRVGEKFNLSLTCHFDREKTLDEIHRIICELEVNLHSEFKEIRRVMIHAEPESPP
jgi:cation diffusion facilitator family transporter